MLPTIACPDVDQMTDHWAWRPEWTPHRPRLLWYLTFERAPDLRAAAAPPGDVLRAAGADVVPTEWLHLTMNHVGFADEVDDRAVRASAEEVGRRLRDEEPFELTLGPVHALSDAVVLSAGPAEPLGRLRGTVVGAMAHTGMDEPDDVDEPFWPHVSLCYLNSRTDRTKIKEMVRAAEPSTVRVRCDRLAQVLVTRTGGHYRWQVLEDVPLGGNRGAGWPARRYAQR